MSHGVYRVVGRRRYRGHDRGTVFEAEIDPEAERRAIDRGDIVLLRRVVPELVPDSYRINPDWLRQEPQTTEAPRGASLI